MLYHVEGIVIRMKDYKENDKIVTIYSRESGKVSFVAHGVKRVKSRHQGVCQQFTCGLFSFYKTKGLGTLRDAEVITTNYEIRADLDRAAYASYLTELLEMMTEEGQSEPALYHSYFAGLQAIASELDARVILHLFELRLLQQLGYAPQFRYCVTCGAEKGNFVISAKAGGVVCDRCVHQDVAAYPIPLKLRSILYKMQQMDITELGAVELSEQTLAELHKVIRGMINYHIDYPWKSRTFLDQWNAMRSP
jgi:DNA repair protein RecO (recombination protein O)